MPECLPDRTPEDLPDRMPDRMSEDMPKDMPDRVPEDMPQHMPEDLPGRMPEDMPDKMPEDMSDRMPEDLPVTKRIDVMVGITRSKVIGLNCTDKSWIFMGYWVKMGKATGNYQLLYFSIYIYIYVCVCLHCGGIASSRWPQIWWLTGNVHVFSMPAWGFLTPWDLNHAVVVTLVA